MNIRFPVQRWMHDRLKAARLGRWLLKTNNRLVWVEPRDVIEGKHGSNDIVLSETVAKRKQLV